MKRKSKCGLTLLEAAVAMGLWVLLAAGVIFLWQHTVRAAERTFAAQDAFENARMAMDTIIANIEMGYRLRLATTPDDVLLSLTAYGYDAGGDIHPFRLTFRPEAGSLDFPQPGNPLARGIDAIYITRAQYHLQIVVRTTCYPPHILYGAACIRHKTFD